MNTSQLNIALLLLASMLASPAHAQPSQAELNRALAKAAERADADQVEALLKKGADPNAQVEGVTAAYWSAIHITRSGDEKVFKKLVNAGLDVNAIDPDSKTSLLGRTVAAGFLKEGEVLIKKYGGKLNHSEPGLIHRALIARSYSAIHYLHKNGVSLDTPDQFGTLPLEYAARDCNPDGVLFLLLGHAQKGHAWEQVQKELEGGVTLAPGMNLQFQKKHLRDCRLVSDLLFANLDYYPKLKSVRILDDGSIGSILRHFGLGTYTKYGATNEAETIKKIFTHDAEPKFSDKIPEVDATQIEAR